MFNLDSRIVLALDAGGTNFVFSAIQGNKEIVSPITLPSNADQLDRCVDTLINGFAQVQKLLPKTAVAISFAFPGPADYENGIIGDLPNFPSFRGGIALGAFLQNAFSIPVFINNDGNLFAYGEALAGTLQDVNAQIKMHGGNKIYQNLLAVTLGTGFGGGVVINNQLLLGDNGCGGDVWLSANKSGQHLIAEEGVSIRAVKRVYKELSNDNKEYTPLQIFEIAEGTMQGNRQAAISSFEELGTIAGFTIAESLNIVDGIVVIGGGIASAHKYIIPAMVTEMNGRRQKINGESFPRLQMKAYDLTNEKDFEAFANDEIKWVQVPESDKKVAYNVAKKTGVTYSKLGTSKAIALGAYAYALAQLDKGK